MPWKGVSGCLVWETGGAGGIETRLGTTERDGDRAVGGVARVRSSLMPGPPPTPGALTGHTQLQGFGELRILGDVGVLHPAAIGPALVPLYPLQRQVPLKTCF